MLLNNGTELLNFASSLLNKGTGLLNSGVYFPSVSFSFSIPH
ncbi:hypothetical protein B4065_3696 [Caldibacillus thermoamylovorans]|nr:hypothetical protein B4065_3696 [Caldibacillus thermoamylovorans]